MGTESLSDLEVKIVGMTGFALSSPYGTGNSLGQPMGVKSVGFVELLTESGDIGLGETYAGVYAPELIEPLAKFLSAYVIGRRLGDLQILGDLNDIPFIGRNGIIRSVSSAIDIALWDLRGQALGVPVHALLNPQGEKATPTYASGGSASYSPLEIITDVEREVLNGANAYKMRVGFQDWELDLERVKVARDTLGNRDLMVDAIMGTLSPKWTAATALERMFDLEQFDLRWLEEPVAPDDIEGLAMLKSKSRVPVAAGEAFSGKLELLSLIERDAVDIFQVDATHSGGISACMELLERATLKGSKGAMHVWGSAAAIAANSHVALATREETILEIPTVALELTQHMWIDAPTFVDGNFHPGEAPGLGVELTAELKDTYRLRPGSGFAIPKKRTS